MKCNAWLLVLLCLSCSQPKDSAYFIPLPFTKFSAIQAPCLDVTIEDQTFSMELDLGFQGDLTLDREALSRISSKTFMRRASLYGAQGKRYPTDLYAISEVMIGTTKFFSAVLQSNPTEFTQDSVFVATGSPSKQEIGRVGWQLFRDACLLIDVPNQMLALCNNLETLATQGYDVDKFMKADLLLNNGLLEFEVATLEGHLRCVLDTGTTRNVLNRETGFSMQEALKSSPAFIIESPTLGTLPFHSAPIQIPIPINAILGMEFFHNHLVFIDFENESVYFLTCCN